MEKICDDTEKILYYIKNYYDIAVSVGHKGNYKFKYYDTNMKNIIKIFITLL